MTAAPIASELTITSDLPEARHVEDVIEFALQAVGFSEHDIFAVKLAVDEALSNAIRHGNQMEPAKRVCVAFTATAERFDVRIEDEGDGFDPENDAPDPYFRGLERPSGRGILLMRGFMTEVLFHGRGNVVTLSKVWEAAQ